MANQWFRDSIQARGRAGAMEGHERLAREPYLSIAEISGRAGASRILAIGAASRQRAGWFDTVPSGGYPSLAQIGGQAGDFRGRTKQGEHRMRRGYASG